MAAGALAVKNKGGETTILGLNSPFRRGRPTVAPPEERIEQILVGKTGEQAIVELPPVALGGGLAIQPHRLLFGFECGRTEGNQIALSGQPAPDFHDEIA